MKVVVVESPAYAKTMRRVVFHEVAEEPVRDSVARPLHIDMGLVGARQARRLGDYPGGPLLRPSAASRTAVSRARNGSRCQSALKIDPLSACKIGPPERHGGGCPGSQ